MPLNGFMGWILNGQLRVGTDGGWGEKRRRNLRHKNENPSASPTEIFLMGFGKKQVFFPFFWNGIEDNSFRERHISS